jgi:hypothetical protein
MKLNFVRVSQLDACYNFCHQAMNFNFMSSAIKLSCEQPVYGISFGLVVIRVICTCFFCNGHFGD